MKDIPVWLSENAEIVDLLSQFIDRLNTQPATDRQRPVAIILNNPPPCPISSGHRSGSSMGSDSKPARRSCRHSHHPLLTGNPVESKKLILVYAAGFKSSASRIRQADGVSLHYYGKSDTGAKQSLEDWWFKRPSCDWPVWFWGDLDYAGMGILKALKQRFFEVRAWPPGYEPMLELLRQQKGHSPIMAGKQAQQDPDTTGCEFADQALLPAIRQAQAFVDQEVVFESPRA